MKRYPVCTWNLYTSFVSRNNERIQIAKRHWTEFDSSYLVEYIPKDHRFICNSCIYLRCRRYLHWWSALRPMAFKECSNFTTPVATVLTGWLRTQTQTAVPDCNAWIAREFVTDARSTDCRTVNQAMFELKREQLIVNSAIGECLSADDNDLFWYISKWRSLINFLSIPVTRVEAVLRPLFCCW